MTDAGQGGTEWVPRFGMLEVARERAELIRGLFELAAFVVDHPEVPLPMVTASIHAPEDGWNAERAFVDRLAAALGVEPRFEADGGHYIAETFFGRVRVYGLAISEDYWARYHAHMSYRGSVEAADAVDGVR